MLRRIGSQNSSENIFLYNISLFSSKFFYFCLSESEAIMYLKSCTREKITYDFRWEKKNTECGKNSLVQQQAFFFRYLNIFSVSRFYFIQCDFYQF